VVKPVPSRTVDGGIPAASTALPAGAVWARRKVHASDRFMMNGQFVELDPRHAGKIVTTAVKDTHDRATGPGRRGHRP
jgi:hypothetical protein